MPPAVGLTIGRLQAIDPAQGIIRLAGFVIRVADPALLQKLTVGLQIAVEWDIVDGQRQALRITGEPVPRQNLV
jgi:hypothetical protein